MALIEEGGEEAIVTAEEIRREIVLALTEAIKKAASEGSLKLRVLPIMGEIELRGLPREVRQNVAQHNKEKPMKMKMAYKALVAKDAADAAFEAFPRTLLEANLLLAGLLLVGVDVIACLWAFVALAFYAIAVIAVWAISNMAIKLLGFTEETLERLALG